MSETKLMDKAVQRKKRNLNIEPHPNLILLIKVESDITATGVYLPESAESPTPVGEIIATGSNIKLYNKGDMVYLDPNRMGFAEIERQGCLVAYEDSIIGKITKEKEDETIR